MVVPPSDYHSRVLIHDRYGFVLTVVAAVGALAAIAGLVRPRILPLVRLYLRVMIALVGVQVAIGLVLVATGDRPQQLIHWFYGAATLLTLPLAMLIGKRLGGREEQIWLAGGAVHDTALCVSGDRHGLSRDFGTNGTGRAAARNARMEDDEKWATARSTAPHHDGRWRYPTLPVLRGDRRWLPVLQATVSTR